MNFSIDDIVNNLYSIIDNNSTDINNKNDIIDKNNKNDIINTEIKQNDDNASNTDFKNLIEDSINSTHTSQPKIERNDILQIDEDNNEINDYSSDKVQSISDILGDYKPKAFHIKKDISKEYENLLYKDNNHLKFIVSDVELFTRLKNDVLSVEDADNDIWALENLRIFSKDFLKSRGFLYCKDVITLLNKYSYLKDSSILQNYNDVYTDRYIYPICMPSGKVFTHMGYNVERLLYSLNKIDTNNNYIVSGLNVEVGKLPSKYQIVSHLWVNQMTLLGNMESLGMYDGNVVYCVEGYFDALRINDEFNKKSIAILGSKLTLEKKTILYQLKRNGCILVYVPDEDEAGLSNVVNDNIWDFVYRNPIPMENRDDNFVVKDVDSYVVNEYLKKANILYRNIDLNINLHDRYKNHIKVPFHELSMIDTIKSLQNKNMY